MRSTPYSGLMMNGFIQIFLLTLSTFLPLGKASAQDQNNNNDDDSVLDVLILGAGWAGIGAAHELNQQDPDLKVQVLEAYHAVGGRSRTIYPFEGKAKDYAIDLGSAWVYEDTEIFETMMSLPKPRFGKVNYDEFRTLAVFVEEGSNNETRQIVDQEFDHLANEVWLGKFAPFCQETSRTLKNAGKDMSFQSMMDQYFKEHHYINTQDPVKVLEKRFIEAIVHAQIDVEHAGPTVESSADEYGKDANDCLFCDGQHFTPVDGGGYDKILKPFVDPVRHKILLNHTVTKIEYFMDNEIDDDEETPIQVTFTHTDEKGETEEGIKVARHVIVTVPLGVLKKKSIAFVPPLPVWKQDAIDYIGHGVLNKAFFYWKTDQSSWWPHGKEMLALLPADMEQIGRYNIFFNDMELGNGGHYVLSGWSGGGPATKYEEELGEDGIYKQVLQNLRSMFGPEVPEPTKYVITQWGQDPLAYGAYSYTRVGTQSATVRKRQILATPMGNLRWAGEATSVEWYGTAVGALHSGLDVAWEVLEAEADEDWEDDQEDEEDPIGDEL